MVRFLLVRKGVGQQSSEGQDYLYSVKNKHQQQKVLKMPFLTLMSEFIVF